MSIDQKDKVFCEIAIDLNYITKDQAFEAFEAQKVDEAVNQKKPVGAYLFEMDFLTKDQIGQIVKMQDKVEASRAVSTTSPEQEASNPQSIAQPYSNKMLLRFGNWNMGGKIIFIASCAAIASMFMNWYDNGIVSQSGLTQLAFVFLGFWIYPLLMLFKNKQMSRIGGLVCSIGSAVLTIVFIKYTTIDLFSKKVYVSGTGAYLFLLASIALTIGVIKYTDPLVACSSEKQ